MGKLENYVKSMSNIQIKIENTNYYNIWNKYLAKLSGIAPNCKHRNLIIKLLYEKIKIESEDDFNFNLNIYEFQNNLQSVIETKSYIFLLAMFSSMEYTLNKDSARELLELCEDYKSNHHSEVYDGLNYGIYVLKMIT